MYKKSAFLALLVALACTHATEPDLGGMPIHSITLTAPMDLSFRSTVEDETLYLLVELHNPNAAAATMSYGDCSFAIQVLALQGASWDNRLPPGMACLDIGRELTVPAGASLSHPVAQVPVASILERVPPGDHAVRVYVRLHGTLRGYEAGTVYLDHDP